MSRDAIKSDDYFKTVKKNLKRDFDAAKVVAGDSFLKSPMDYSGLLLERHRECLIYYLNNGDTNYFRGIFAFVSRAKDLDKLIGYAEYLFPVHIINDDEVRVSRRGDGYEPIEIIDFYLYKKLSSAIKVNNSNITKLKREVRNMALRRWVWNLPPELGQDMASTTTGGMAWTAPRF